MFNELSVPPRQWPYGWSQSPNNVPADPQGLEPGWPWKTSSLLTSIKSITCNWNSYTILQQSPSHTCAHTHTNSKGNSQLETEQERDGLPPAYLFPNIAFSPLHSACCFCYSGILPTSSDADTRSGVVWQVSLCRGLFFLFFLFFCLSVWEVMFWWCLQMSWGSWGESVCRPQMPG